MPGTGILPKVPTEWTARSASGTDSRSESATNQIDALQLAIPEELARTGRAFLSTTRLHGKTTLRLCFVSWRTTAADVEEVVRLLSEIGARLENA